MTSLLEDVIAQNNATVAFMQSQDLPSALNSSMSVLDLQRMLTRSSSMNRSSSSPSITACLDRCVYYSGIDRIVSLETSSTENKFIHRQGVLLPPEASDSSMITSIVIFNAALVHHLAATQIERVNKEDVLQRALRLYEFAYESHNMDENVLFQFIVINNIAAIQHDSGNVEAARECFDYLTSLYMVFLDQQERSCCLQIHYVRGFAANISLPIIACAAAA